MHGSSRHQNLGKHAQGNKFHNQQCQVWKPNTAVSVFFVEPIEKK